MQKTEPTAINVPYFGRQLKKFYIDSKSVYEVITISQFEFNDNEELI